MTGKLNSFLLCSKNENLGRCDRTSDISHGDTDITMLCDFLDPWPVMIQGNKKILS